MKPAIGRKRPRINRHLTDLEFTQILDYYRNSNQPKYYLLFLTQAATGLRLDEVRHIHLGDFSESFKSLRVRLAKTDDIKIKQLPYQLTALIIHYVRHNYHLIKVCQGFIFGTNNPANTTGVLSKKHIWAKLREAVDACGICDKQELANGKFAYRIGTHSIRRLAITKMLQQTENIFFVKEWIGHRKLNVTMNYANPAKFLETEQERVNELFSGLTKIKIKKENKIDCAQTPLNRFV